MSKVSESDIRMMLATQVAYLDSVKGKTVKENIDRIISAYESNPNPSEKDKGQYNTAVYLRSKIEESGTQDCYNWVVKEACDNNNVDGFYGCLIDTKDGDAIVGFRGSESYDTTQAINDWGGADLGLLGNTQTRQQQTAQAFTDYIYRKYGNSYDSYNFSGHSLGGNLAEHSTLTAPDGMNIGRCTSWDGPGFSDEYIALHAADIAKRCGNIDHYQWSVVGTMLFPIPGTNYTTIAAHNDSGHFPGTQSLFRHDTKNIDFGPDGQIVKETIFNMRFDDYLARLTELRLGGLSKVLEWGSSFLISSFAFFKTGCQLMYKFGEFIISGINSFGEMIGNIADSVVNWFKKTFGSSVEGKYSIYTSQISSSADELERISERICQIGVEAESISRKIKYNSISGAYLKSKIGNIGNSLNSYGNKGVRISSATQSAVARINKVDSSVGDKFYALSLQRN